MGAAEQPAGTSMIPDSVKKPVLDTYIAAGGEKFFSSEAEKANGRAAMIGMLVLPSSAPSSRRRPGTLGPRLGWGAALPGHREEGDGGGQSDPAPAAARLGPRPAIEFFILSK